MKTETEFNELIEETLRKIEYALDDIETDIDYETSTGILTLTFENGSKIIINRQTPVRQLWLASMAQAYHFDYDGKQWVCDRSGDTLTSILNTACTKQAGEKVSLENI